MRLAHDNDIELEGACEGSLACSTCHVIVEPEYYKMLEEPTDEENDMLDLAYGLSETYPCSVYHKALDLRPLRSRLGCQVKLRRDLDGITVTIPSATRNMAVDGFKPKPH